MKKINLILFAFCLPLASLSQNGIVSANPIAVENPKMTFDTYCLQNAISYMVIPSQKLSSVQFEGELQSLENDANATYEDYGIALKENATQYFKLIGSDKILAVKSMYSLRLSYSSVK